MGVDALVVRPTNAKGGAENCAGTNNGVKHIDRWLALEGGAWDVIHFNFGLHDLKHVDPESAKNSNDPAHSRQAEPERYRAQLREITSKLAATDARLVFATTTPVPPGGVRPFRDPEDVLRYNAIALEVVEEFEVAIDDLYAFAVPRMAEMMKPVNVHFTPEGSAALGEQVAEAVRAVAGWAPN
jgi:lysophospholipase L1-like esterase